MRPHPTITSTSRYRPSAEALTSGHDSAVGKSSSTTGSSTGSAPSVWKRTCRWYSSPFGYARVPEPAQVSPPGDRGGAGVGDHVVELRSGLGAQHVQHAVLGAALGQAVRHQRAVGRRMEPVDRHRAVGREHRRVEQDACRSGRIARRTHGEHELIGVLRTLVDEQVRATHRRPEHRGNGRERGEALVPPSPTGPGLERLTCSGVVRSDPSADFGGIAVFEPAVWIGDRHAVVDVVIVAAPRRGCRGD